MVSQAVTDEVIKLAYRLGERSAGLKEAYKAFVLRRAEVLAETREFYPHDIDPEGRAYVGIILAYNYKRLGLDRTRDESNRWVYFKLGATAVANP